MATTLKPVTLAGKSAQDVLDILRKTYTFGAAMDKALAEYQEARDPLLATPSFINTREVPVRETRSVGRRVIMLGQMHGYTCILEHNSDSGCVLFRKGCQIMQSESKARRHWRDNVSRSSGMRRPDTDKLIDWVAAICRHRGWTW